MLTSLLIFLSVFLYKTGYFVRRFKQLKHTMLRKITCDRMRKFIVIKEKSLFIPIRSVIPYILGIHSTSSSLKKKKKNFRKKRGKRDENKWKRGEEEKGMERVCAKVKKKKEERKEERMKEKEKEKKEEEEKEEQKIERMAQEMHRPLRTHSLARS